MSKTITIQIGNSDNKLTQQEWAEYVNDLKKLTQPFNVHFSGGSPIDAPWQNYCTVLVLTNGQYLCVYQEILKGMLAELCDKYRQDSIAVTTGDTEFIGRNYEVKKGQ